MFPLPQNSSNSSVAGLNTPDSSSSPAPKQTPEMSSVSSISSAQSSIGSTRPLNKQKTNSPTDQSSPPPSVTPQASASAIQEIDPPKSNDQLAEELNDLAVAALIALTPKKSLKLCEKALRINNPLPSLTTRLSLYHTLSRIMIYTSKGKKTVTSARTGLNLIPTNRKTGYTINQYRAALVFDVIEGLLMQNKTEQVLNEIETALAQDDQYRTNETTAQLIIHRTEIFITQKKYLEAITSAKEGIGLKNPQLRSSQMESLKKLFYTALQSTYKNHDTQT